MPNSASFRKHIEGQLSQSKMLHWQPISGGDINAAYQLRFDSGATFFLKTNPQMPPSFFKAEALGLAALDTSESLRVPKVVHWGSFEETSYLILEWIESGIKAKAYPRLLAEGMMKLHKQSAAQFGWTQDNYIGSLKQANNWLDSWPKFYAENRILPKLKKAYDMALLSRSDLKMAEGFLKAYPSLIPKEKPALLHGDLWSGNVISDEEGRPVLIDPSVYYGYREMDLAMMKLFGGFPAAFYQEYEAIFPLHGAWQERIPYHQLYPLLVHLILFGKAYYADCQKVWEPFA